LGNETVLEPVLWQFLQYSIEHSGVLSEIIQGLTLGSLLSPSLGPVYLSPLDNLTSKSGTKLGRFYRRYKDEWGWLIPNTGKTLSKPTNKYALRLAIKQQYLVLESLQIELLPNKTLIGQASKFFRVSLLTHRLNLAEQTLSRHEKKLT